MIGLSHIIGDVMILGLALWGQHWKSKYERARDTIEFMIEGEADADLAEDLQD